MAGYKDRTYCHAWKECFFGEGCRNALTALVGDEARKLTMEISQVASRECFVKKGDETAKDIVEKYLLDNGYDGLYSDYGCGCLIGDLTPCGGESLSGCRPGYKTRCDCGEHVWHVSKTRD